jgi:hypothetical protein
LFALIKKIVYSFLLDSSYFVKVAFLNVTDSNIAYPYVLPGCPAFECPFETFTSLYEPRFPASADIECIE